MATYSDATLGWKIPGWQSLHDLLLQYMPRWGAGVSYATRILAGPTSAMVAVTDTPELFGGEIHALASVDFRDGQIVRWIDYWDSTSFQPAVLEAMAAGVQAYPEELGEREIECAADPAIEAACTRFHEALASGGEGLSDLLTYDVVYEDMGARLQLIGRSAVLGYLTRVIDLVPFGPRAGLLHVVGGPSGGGYEWKGAPASEVPRGLSALELDEIGAISRITTVYDSARFGPMRCRKLREATSA
ncbi:hypothetical protein RLDS_04245 [Sphingobium lactosutens DS20]|uniref:SnoaL-like domain-containing protein n=2 Tax=Sphingobium TaxID=165695 RepID=T0J5B1_9SPHN|nr:hypothetical protein RLDS_04245 [Sphingobium lactosutens DS20]